MSIYAIGDLQGCFESLELLLTRLPLRWDQDQLWFVGDLVNRGPHSLEVLRYVKGLGSRAVCVLGNHDLHLLSVSEGFAPLHRGDTLDGVLEACDRIELLEWLRQRPLIHCAQGYTMVHAGLLPQWDVRQAKELAGEVEQALRAASYREFLKEMYGNRPHRWSPGLAGMDRLRLITNGLTRLRICSADGSMEFAHKGALCDIPKGYMPWFQVPGRRSAGENLIFGHWSALGLHLDQPSRLLALDTGCLWGGHLTAVRLEDLALFQVSCPRRSHH